MDVHRITFKNQHALNAAIQRLKSDHVSFASTTVLVNKIKHEELASFDGPNASVFEGMFHGIIRYGSSPQATHGRLIEILADDSLQTSCKSLMYGFQHYKDNI